MDNFKKASKVRLRFNTSKGLLSVEQLWDLKLTPLASIVRSLKKQLKKDNDDELAFLDEKATPVDETLKLSFDVAKEVYIAKKAERDAVATEAEKKAHNQKILGLIADKQEEGMKGKTVDELTALLKA